MADKKKDEVFTPATSSEILPRGVVGPGSVPAAQDIRKTENVALDKTANRTRAVPERIKNMDGAGNIHFYIDGKEVSEEEFNSK